MVYSGAERMFILEQYFAVNSFAALRETFSNEYSYNGVRIRKLVTKPRERNVCGKWSQNDKTAELGAVPISSSVLAATNRMRIQ
jgi:hypothetical protein